MPISLGKKKSVVTQGSWTNVQSSLKNSVVQIFTKANYFNWVEPYKTPYQISVAGTGFFIDKQGHILTNHHVVEEAFSVEIQLQEFGGTRFSADVLGVCPYKDIALLKLTTESFNQIVSVLGGINYLSFGDSDKVVRAQEILALGYPLGQERLKSTVGIISGREQNGMVQISAAINPGNSGGPTIDFNGNVVGINTLKVHGADNVGYMIPINEVKVAIDTLKRIKLLREPYYGCYFSHSTPEVIKFSQNPKPGGYRVVAVFKNSIFEAHGIKENDMIYEVNGYKVDSYGDVSVPWSDDKISLFDYLGKFILGDSIKFVIYRDGKRLEFFIKLSDKYLPAIRTIYSKYEKTAVDYEIFGGLVVMPLSLNHVSMFLDYNEQLISYMQKECRQEHALIITHVLPNSQADNSRLLDDASIIDLVNGKKVKTLNDFRQAILSFGRSNYFTVKTINGVFVVLSMDKILRDEEWLAENYYYKVSNLVKTLA